MPIRGRTPATAPYMGHKAMPMHQRDIVIHDFKLTERGRLSASVLRAIAEHPNVWWRPEKYRKEQEEGSISNHYRRGERVKARGDKPKDKDTRKRPRESDNPAAKKDPKRRIVSKPATQARSEKRKDTSPRRSNRLRKRPRS